MTKEEIYDQQISHHMAEIIKICRKHRIAFVATYSIPSPDDEGLQCASALLEQDCEPPPSYLEAMRLIYGHARSPAILTVRDGNGDIKEMHAIL